MIIEDLKIICCPITFESFKLINPVFDGEIIVSGTLKSSLASFPIINSIPRFVKNDGYCDNFSFQWKHWKRLQFQDNNIGSAMEKHTKKMFKSLTKLSSKKIKDKIVLDIGCGAGRFSDVALHLGAKVIALDFSFSIDIAKDNFLNNRKKILFIQADAYNMPFRNNSVDYAFSIGVLHHTPNPILGVKEAYRVLRKRGEFSISVYADKSFYTFINVRIWNYIFKTLKPILSFYPPLLYSYIFGFMAHFLAKIWIPLSYPLRVFFPTAILQDYRWSILDTFDALTTNYQSGHTPDQIKNWFKEAKFHKIKRISKNNFLGNK
jgi:ubiquinone/menaquinone biosynthesis C-methylase UbiE